MPMCWRTAGVDSVIELATRRAENLYIKVAEIAVQGIRRIPKIDEVRDWIEQAKQLIEKCITNYDNIKPARGTRH